jgi:hypothetical protein
MMAFFCGEFSQNIDINFEKRTFFGKLYFQKNAYFIKENYFEKKNCTFELK